MAAVIIAIAGVGVVLSCGDRTWGTRAWADSDAAPTRQFSAELVGSNAAGDIVGAPGRIFVSEFKVRIEIPEFPDSFFLIDASRPTAYFARPQSRVFMDAKQSSRLTQLFVPIAGDDPCAQWATMAEVAGIPDQSGHWQCRIAEHETVEGRNTVKFGVTSPRGSGAGWIDQALKFPVKVETEDRSVFALRNIHEGPQAADLFVIPADYKKFEPRLLLEWLKNSDVLVEPAGQSPNQ